MGTHLRALSETYPMDTNMTEFRWLSKSFYPCALEGLSSTRESAAVDR